MYFSLPLAAMLPPLYAEHYQTLRTALAELIANLDQAEQNPVDLRSDFLWVRQYFQQQVANLDPGLLAPALQSRLGSYHTEINKELRLLETDWVFLQAARQTQTFTQRKALIRDRLQRLLDYCDALLA